MTPYADQLAAQQRQWESTCDCCPDTGRADELRRLIEREPGFVAEAIGNADLTDLIAAHLAGDQQWIADALTEIVDDYLTELVDSQLNRTDVFRPRDEVAALENIARLWGVVA
jgi:hypothetical protein